MKPTRREIQQALKVVQSASLNFTANQSLKDLSRRGFGHVVGREYRIERAVKRQLKEWLSQQGISWQSAWSDFGGDRVQTASAAIDEKLSRSDGDAGRVLIATWGDPIINGAPVPGLEGAYLSMSQTAVSTVECDCFMIVENYQAFTSMHRLAGSVQGRILAVYRGDPERPGGQVWCQKMSAALGVPLAVFADFDPAGLCIALHSGASSAVLPMIDAIGELQGSTHDFTNQHIQWQQLRSTELPGALAPYIDFLSRRQAGFTQERLLAHEVEHVFIDLTGEPGHD